MSRSARQRLSRGLTLIELMVVVAVIVVIISLAAPSFKRTIEMQRLRGIHDQAITDLQFARSEAVRTGVPVHFRVRKQSGVNGACYIIFSDRNLGFSAPLCDCYAAPGARCTVAETTEIKTVQLEPGLGIDFGSITVAQNGRIAFDPVTGGTLIQPVDGGDPRPGGLTFQTTMGVARAVRADVAVTGRPTSCAPPGSTVTVVAC